MSQNRSAATLSDALYELSLAQRVPDAPLLDEFVRRYPEYADDLTDFAIILFVRYHSRMYRGQISQKTN